VRFAEAAGGQSDWVGAHFYGLKMIDSGVVDMEDHVRRGAWAKI
jgi:hypothetical protein